MMLPIKAYVKPVTLEVGPLLAQGYYLNKCGRGLLDNTYIPKVKALGLVVSDKKFFFHVAPNISLCKTCDSRGWASFGPRTII